MPNEEMMARNMFAWEHFHVYLSGAIDFDRKGGRNWREEWTDKLLSIGFTKQQIFNPCKKPLPKNAPFNLDDESHIINAHREKHEWSELCSVVDQIAHVDLRLVDKADIILVNFPKLDRQQFYEHVDYMDAGVLVLADLAKSDHLYDSQVFEIRRALHKMTAAFKSLLEKVENLRVPTYGTIHEIVVARQQRKPVYIVWEGGKETCSGWLMWLVGHQNVFSTVEELLTRLDNISKGKAAYNAKDWLLLDLDGDGLV